MERSLRVEWFENNPIALSYVDAAGRIVDTNLAYLAMSRRTREELIGRYSVDFVHADDLAELLVGLDRLEAGAKVVRHQRRHLRGDGTWVENVAFTSYVYVGDERYVQVQLVEIGEAQDVEVEREAELRLHLQPFGDTACFHDERGTIVFLTEELGAALGRPPEWFVRRRFTDPELGAINLDGSPLHEALDPVLVAMRTGEIVTQTVGFHRTDGTVAWMSVRASAVATERYPARSTLRDITELIHAQQQARHLAAIVEQELTYRADHDSLTGLAQRHVVVAAIEERIEREQNVSVVFVDLDRFKAINDEFGHLVGDEVLVSVAQRLVEVGGEALVLGRTGGDEFVAAFAEPEAAERFRSGLVGSTLTTAPLPAVSGSVGCSHHVLGDGARDLLRRADDEMYRAKRSSVEI